MSEGERSGAEAEAFPGAARPTPRENRMRPGVEREYHGEGYAVTWEPGLCVHSGNCWRGLRAVFRPWDRPWVHIDAADRDRIAEVVATCPSQAIKFVEEPTEEG